MQGPFSGHGIPEDLSNVPAELAEDEYVGQLRELLSSDSLFRGTLAETRKLQEELLYPYLEFFLRHDYHGYYHRLFRNRGLTDNRASLRSDIVLEDLARLRIHSDDLRGAGQRERLIAELQPGSNTGAGAPPGGIVGRSSAGLTFVSSGTTAGTEGPVRLFRSKLSLDLSRHANAALINWALKRRVEGGEALMHMAPEMTDFTTFAAIGADFFRHRGARVRFGAKLREGPADSSTWQRLTPDSSELRRFFKSQVDPKYLISTGGGLYRMLVEPEGTRRMGMKMTLGVPPIYLGDSGVLMIGGGLKRLPGRYNSLSQLLTELGESIKAGWTKDAAPAPVIDMLGLTESLTVFMGVPMDPGSTDPRVKYPHPLTYTALLESPTHLEPAETWDDEAERLLFYVNFMNLDYLEAVVPGDFVYPAPAEPSTSSAVGELHLPQRGFIYSRRAGLDEGFQVREGSG